MDQTENQTNPICLIWKHWTYKMLVRYITCRVCVKGYIHSLNDLLCNLWLQVGFQLTHFSFDNCESICTSFHYHHQIGNMNHYSLGLQSLTMVFTVLLAMFLRHFCFKSSALEINNSHMIYHRLLYTIISGFNTFGLGKLFFADMTCFQSSSKCCEFIFDMKYRCICCGRLCLLAIMCASCPGIIYFGHFFLRAEGNKAK